MTHTAKQPMGDMCSCNNGLSWAADCDLCSLASKLDKLRAAAEAVGRWLEAALEPGPAMDPEDKNDARDALARLRPALDQTGSDGR